MGNVLSGRRRTRNRGTVERAMGLDMRHLRRIGLVRPSARAESVIGWTFRGAPAGSVSLAIDLRNPLAGFAELRFVAGGQPDATPQRIEIDATPCRFGGHRFRFVCAHTGRRCDVVYSGGRDFASRQHHRLVYAAQTEDTLARLRRAREAARERALGEKGQPRPRGANRERLVAAWRAAERAYEVAFVGGAVRRLGFEVT